MSVLGAWPASLPSRERGAALIHEDIERGGHFGGQARRGHEAYSSDGMIPFYSANKMVQESFLSDKWFAQEKGITK